MSGGDDTMARRLGLGLGGGSGAGAVWLAPTPEALAEAIPGLRVLGVAGRGGMGVVYRAEQTRLGRLVAVKVLAPAGGQSGAAFDPLAEERFEREARVLAGLAHPRVLQIHDAGRLTDGTRYLVTEWAEGGDLAGVLAGKAQEPGRVAAWVAQIAEGLDAAHAKGVVHRDLKPANVLVRADGGLALADFGLARAAGAGFTTALTLSGTVFGTLDYMAPEQLGASGAEAVAEVTKAADIYALGVMAYQMLTGRVPRGVFVRASQVAGVPKAVDAVIAEALAAEPAERPPSAGDFARRLAAALRRGDWSGGRGRRLATVVAVGACLTGAAVVYVVLREDRGTDVETARPTTTEAASAARPVETGVAPAGVALNAEAAVAEPSGGQMRWLLAEVEPSRDRAGGGWERVGEALRSDDGVCALRVPTRVPEDYRYDVEMEFTRLSGRNSVGVCLPTSSGVGVFELDAWDAGLGGVQMIDDQDMRTHGEHFPGPLRNGERQSVTLAVRGARVTAVWNGRTQRSWDLTGRRFGIPWLWEAGGDMRLGLCSWQSPTLFHRFGLRPAGATTAE